jgi:glycosyltransferase involved in cell wall biosynthesis
MNILHINQTHFFRGGAHTVYIKTAELMEKHGHKSLFFSMHHPDNISCKYEKYFMPFMDMNASCGIMEKLKIAGTILYSFEARKRLTAFLDNHQVDIAHLHNIYHVPSPSILHVLKKRNIPVVLTIHNYKLVCASYLLFLRDPVRGAVCEDCRGGRYYMTVKNRCVKNSFAKSFLAALEMYLHHSILNIYENVDVFIATSRFIKDKLKDMGFKRETVYLPNFYETDALENTNSEKSRDPSGHRQFIYVGRLAPEKGLSTLLDAAKILQEENVKLVIKMSGKGPMKQYLMEKINRDKIRNVRFLGFIKYSELCAEIQKSLAVVLPTECYENNPLSVIESFAMGVPAIGSRHGGIPELVKDNATGLTFEPGNAPDMSQKIKQLLNNPELSIEWGNNARKLIRKELTADIYYEKLISIYNQLLRKRAVHDSLSLHAF